MEGDKSMSLIDEKPSFFISLVVSAITSCLILVGFVIGFSFAKHSLQRDAIRDGVAEWVSTGPMVKEFRWKGPMQ
jgi:hypothetical protein